MKWQVRALYHKSVLTMCLGGCFQENVPHIDFSIIAPLNLMTPANVHAWMWVYLAVNILWAISSITLITGRKIYRKSSVETQSNLHQKNCFVSFKQL